MRRLARIPVSLGAAALFCASHATFAQQPQAVTERMKTVVVWIVNEKNDPNPLAARAKVAQVTIDPLGYKESTAGDFGHVAMGTGQTAGTAGKTSGDFGRTAGSVGANAGDAGSTMANFGTSTTNLASVAAAKNGSFIPAANRPRRDPNWAAIVDSHPFDPGLVYPTPQPIAVTYVDVYRNDLQPLLEAAANTLDAPDVLIGNPLPASWSRPETGLAARLGLPVLWNAPHVIVSEGSPERRLAFNPEATVLNTALNPDGARAYCLWLLDEDGVQGTYTKSSKNDPIAQLAIRAMLTLLAGASVGVDGDPEMAKISGSLAAAAFAGPSTVDLQHVKVHADVTRLQIFGPLAFVTVRAIGASAETFGVAHALVILRKDVNGKWKVLQVSPNLDGRAQSRAWAVLTSFSAGSPLLTDEGNDAYRNEGTKVLGISQAIPKDGDALSPQPEMWWDNLGGATLQAVEWQQGTGEAWGASTLYFIPDNNARLRTRATARFASTPGQYRWRVWSVGKGGDVVLSPWRTMKIIG